MSFINMFMVVIVSVAVVYGSSKLLQLDKFNKSFRAVLVGAVVFFSLLTALAIVVLLVKLAMVGIVGVLSLVIIGLLIVIFRDWIFYLIFGDLINMFNLTSRKSQRKLKREERKFNK